MVNADILHHCIYFAAGDIGVRLLIANMKDGQQIQTANPSNRAIQDIHQWQMFKLDIHQFVANVQIGTSVIAKPNTELNQK